MRIVRALVIAAALGSPIVAACAPEELSASTLQARFDSKVDQADRVVVALATGLHEGSDPILTLTDPEEVSALKRHVRLQRIKQPIVDAEGNRSLGCGCYGEFRIEVLRGDDLIMAVVTHHFDSVVCTQIVPDGSIEVEASHLLAFLGRVVEGLPEHYARRRQVERMLKNRGEPGATDNPDDAQRLREDH